MSDQNNPMGREYTRSEIAAARRLGLGNTNHEWTPNGYVKHFGGVLIYAAGPYWPDYARRMAADWALVSAALDREWAKGAISE